MNSRPTTLQIGKLDRQVEGTPARAPEAALA
jgi:hypothetical protein